MTTNFSKKSNDRPIAHHDDEDLATLPKEGTVNVSESDWCVICGQDSRKKRKRESCNTYAAHKPLPKTLQTMLRKYSKNDCLSEQLDTRTLFF